MASVHASVMQVSLRPAGQPLLFTLHRSRDGFASLGLEKTRNVEGCVDCYKRLRIYAHIAMSMHPCNYACVHIRAYSCTCACIYLRHVHAHICVCTKNRSEQVRVHLYHSSTRCMGSTLLGSWDEANPWNLWSFQPPYHRGPGVWNRWLP